MTPVRGLLPFLLIAAPSLHAQEEARAKGVLTAAAARFKDVQTLKATAEWSQDGVNAKHQYTIYLKKPNLWRTEQIIGQRENHFIHDGKQVWNHMKTGRKFIRNMAYPSTIQSTGGPIAQLFVAPDASLVLERTSKLTLKRDKLEDKDYDVVCFWREWDNSNVEIWIDAERKIRKTVMSGKIGGEVNATTFRRTFEYLSEEDGPELAPELFAFTPPPDVMEFGAPRDRDGSLLQEGTEAQDVEAVDAAGKKVKLSDFKGKPVALLFWTENGDGCADALAAFDRMQAAYKGVVFLAVNQGDAAPAMKTFLQKSKVTVRVLRQKTDEVSQAFGIQKYPTAYVLSGERKVVLRHGGFYEDRVREALDKIAPKK
jgi:peroxiredoxin/outer membrane lipoprotein-sorting protein